MTDSALMPHMVKARTEAGVGWLAPNGGGGQSTERARQALEYVTMLVRDPDVHTIVITGFAPGPPACAEDPELAAFCQQVVQMVWDSSKTMIVRRSPGRRSDSDREPCYVEPLSMREFQVLSLVCDGLSAREIGMRLFITERTVESHVSNGYRKLGINSRVELIRRKTEFGF